MEQSPKKVIKLIRLSPGAAAELERRCRETQRRSSNVIDLILLWARGKTIPGLEPIQEHEKR